MQTHSQSFMLQIMISGDCPPLVRLLQRVNCTLK